MKSLFALILALCFFTPSTAQACDDYRRHQGGGHVSVQVAVPIPFGMIYLGNCPAQPYSGAICSGVRMYGHPGWYGGRYYAATPSRHHRTSASPSRRRHDDRRSGGHSSSGHHRPASSGHRR